MLCYLMFFYIIAHYFFHNVLIYCFKLFYLLSFYIKVTHCYLLLQLISFMAPSNFIHCSFILKLFSIAFTAIYFIYCFLIFTLLIIYFKLLHSLFLYLKSHSLLFIFAIHFIVPLYQHGPLLLLLRYHLYNDKLF